VRENHYMRESFVYAVLLMVICGGIYLVTEALDLINEPSDLKVAGGIGVIIVVLVLFPAAMRWIWHHKTTPHGRPIVVTARPISVDEERSASNEKTKE
jgi:hypothetical protein